MKILFVLENYIPHIGGVEIVFKNLCEGLALKGYDITIVTHKIKKTKNFEIINNVNIYRVACFQSRYLFTFFSIPKVLALAKHVDIIHTTTFNGALPAWIASKLLNKKCIITVHEVWVGKWIELTEMIKIKAIIHNLLERFIYFLNFDMYVCVSKSTKKQLLDIGIAKSKTTYIYNGVNYNHWNPDRYDGLRIRKQLTIENNIVGVFTGRPGISKGLEYLIKAIPSIIKKVPQFKLLAIVSKDNAYRNRYKLMLDLISDLKLENNIIMHDTVPYDELPNYIMAADCIIVPSLAEGFGFAVAEACAMNKPVVATNTTSIPEVISGKYVLVSPRDPEAIARGVFEVYSNNFQIKNSKMFSLEDNINRYEDIYLSLLKDSIKNKKTSSQ